MSLDTPSLTDTPLFQHYVQTLLAGHRPACRQLVERAGDCGVGAEQVLLELCWPAMESIQQLYKDNRISLAAHHMATRLNRATVDRLTGNLPMQAATGRKVLLICGDNEPEELGGQITADLFEAAGFEVKFLGGGIPNDEVLHIIGHWQPDLPEPQGAGLQGQLLRCGDRRRILDLRVQEAGRRPPLRRERRHRRRRA